MNKIFRPIIILILVLATLITLNKYSNAGVILLQDAPPGRAFPIAIRLWDISLFSDSYPPSTQIYFNLTDGQVIGGWTGLSNNPVSLGEIRDVYIYSGNPSLIREGDFIYVNGGSTSSILRAVQQYLNVSINPDRLLPVVYGDFTQPVPNPVVGFIAFHIDGAAYQGSELYGHVIEPLPINGIPPRIVASGTAYSFTPSAPNATSFTIFNKPGWATFNTATGTLSGTPQASDAGTASIVYISAVNGNLTTALPPFDIMVFMPPPTISGTPATTGTVGLTYNFYPYTSNATSFSYSGTLPPGLSFNDTNGVISGIPTTAGTYDNIQISVTNTSGSASLSTFSITVGYLLSATVIGNGTVQSSSTVAGVPSDIHCSSGTCSAGYPSGNIVTLTAKPNPTSTFGSWSDSCTADPCNVTMDATKGVTATFNQAPLAMNITTNTPYSTLSDALTMASSGAEVQILGVLYNGAISLNGAIILNGGWNATYLDKSGFPSTLNGDLTILDGDSTTETVVVNGKLAIQGGSLRVKDVMVHP